MIQRDRLLIKLKRMGGLKMGDVLHLRACVDDAVTAKKLRVQQGDWLAHR